MKIKYKGEKMYEFYPEDDVEVPTKFYVRRNQDIGPGTEFDWIAYGYHPKARGTITLVKYFSTMQEAHRFIKSLSGWEELLKSENLLNE